MENKNVLTMADYMHSDEVFDQLFPQSMRSLARRHWTPLHVAKQAAEFYEAGQACKILDIGSGVGKFCLAAAAYAPDALFFGVEQRPLLVDYALQARGKLGVPNASFIEANFTQLDMKRYDHFYFYNSFHENIDDSDRIDERISYSFSLYDFYIRQLHKGFKSMPSGTKIVTYHTLWNEIPREYRLEKTSENGALNFWIKR